jgi:hypothetical protein
MIQLFDYQQNLYSNLINHLKTNDIVCLAADTASGKTEMACKYVQDNPDKKVIIFAHNQRILKKNFSDRLAKYNLPYTTNIQDYLSGACNVLVGIPAGIYKHVDSLPQADTIIIDEAHEYYQNSKTLGKKMYTKILDWHKGKTLLLTATHFELTGMPKEYFSRNEALELGRIANIKEKLVSTDLVKLRQEYLNRDGEIKETVKATNFIDTPAEIVKPLLKTDTHGEIIPTLVIAPTSHIAIDMYKALKESGYNTGIDLSRKGYDKNGLDLLRAGVIDICIVKDKGRLGYDYPDLGIVIDCSFSQNITRMVQFKRSGRLSDKPYAKEYIKVAPDNQFEHYRLLLCASIYIGEKENFRTFNGQYDTVRIPQSELIRDDQIIIAGHRYDIVKEDGRVSLQKDGEEVFTAPLVENEIPNRKAIKDHLIESGQIKQTPSGERRNDPYGRPQAVCEEFTASLEECLGMFGTTETTTLKEGFEYIKSARGESIEVAIGFKYCTKCKTVKAAAEMCSDKRRSDGLASECKSCQRERFKKYYRENLEKVMENTRKYRQENTEKHRERTRKWREENPEKYKEKKKRDTLRRRAKRSGE